MIINISTNNKQNTGKVILKDLAKVKRLNCLAIECNYDCYNCILHERKWTIKELEFTKRIIDK